MKIYFILPSVWKRLPEIHFYYKSQCSQEICTVKHACTCYFKFLLLIYFRAFDLEINSVSLVHVILQLQTFHPNKTVHKKKSRKCKKQDIKNFLFLYFIQAKCGNIGDKNPNVTDGDEQTFNYRWPKLYKISFFRLEFYEMCIFATHTTCIIMIYICYTSYISHISYKSHISYISHISNINHIHYITHMSYGFRYYVNYLKSL